VHSETGGQRLQLNAELDEVVEIDGTLGVAIKLAHQYVVELVGQSVPKCGQRLFELFLVDTPGVVGVEGPETVEPIVHISPQLGELLEVNGSRVVPIKHADHKPHRFGVEWFPRAVREGGLQFIGIDGTGSVGIHAGEHTSEPLVVRHD